MYGKLEFFLSLFSGCFIANHSLLATGKLIIYFLIELLLLWRQGGRKQFFYSWVLSNIGMRCAPSARRLLWLGVIVYFLHRSLCSAGWTAAVSVRKHRISEEWGAGGRVCCLSEKLEVLVKGIVPVDTIIRLEVGLPILPILWTQLKYRRKH